MRTAGIGGHALFVSSAAAQTGGVRGDERVFLVGAAEGEVDSSRDVDLPELGALGGQHQDPGRGRDVDPALPSTLMPWGQPGDVTGSTTVTSALHGCLRQPGGSGRVLRRGERGRLTAARLSRRSP